MALPLVLLKEKPREHLQQKASQSESGVVVALPRTLREPIDWDYVVFLCIARKEQEGE